MSAPTVGLRPELPPLPDRIARLPRHRGYPVPWFVGWVDGSPDFRVFDGEKFVRAVREGLCWVCGEKLGAHLAFVIGPMCAVNRISAEPPSHRECAEFSARACPFLSRPTMRRREGSMPDGAGDMAGFGIRRNPGVALVWVTKRYGVVRVSNGNLFRVGDPRDVQCFAEGRTATVDEIAASFWSGLPILAAEARADGPHAVRALVQQGVQALRVLGVVAPRPGELIAAAERIEAVAAATEVSRA